MKIEVKPEIPRQADVVFLERRGIFGVKKVAYLVTDVVGDRVYLSAGGPMVMLSAEEVKHAETWRPRNLGPEERQQIVAASIGAKNPVGLGYQSSTIPPFLGTPLFGIPELHRVITTCGFFDKVVY